LRLIISIPLLSTLLNIFYFSLFAYISYIFANNVVSSDSPPFARQQIIDNQLDWYAENTTLQYFSDSAKDQYVNANKLFNAENVSDISSITASSDGKILNITFWLDGPFNEHPIKTSPDYYVRFDTDSNIGTGDNFGADYLFIVS
jgi:hypothetical protein